MTKETKYVSFAELKARTEGPGGWEGYLSKTGEIDDGGDLILQGAYADTLGDFLTRGFNAESHDWTFSKMIGFPVSAKEDDEGLYVVSQYHGTPDAQLVRQKAQERMNAGKGVYMSIGYEPAAAPIFVTPEEYAKEIPQYSRKGMEEQNLLKALNFPRIRILPKVSLYEGSIVSMPMLRSAEVTAVKHSDVPGSLVDGPTYAEELATVVDAVQRLMDRTEKRAEMRTKEGRVLSTANYEKLMSLYQQLGELLEGAKPQPKQDATADTEEEAKALMVEANALIAEHYARQPRLRALRTSTRS